MRQPYETFLRCDIRDIERALARLEAQMDTFHFVGQNADEIKALTQRLVNLTDPLKGHLTGGARAKELRDAA